MFGTKFPLFKLFGFQVSVDVSWFFIFVLVSWSLATVAFPGRTPGLTETTYWTMGVAGALGLFLCIVLHELAHSLVARRFGIEMKGITLFIFGGVAEMTGEPKSPGAEFFVAIAGPIASMLLAAVSALAYVAGDALGWPASIVGVVGYFALMNTMLVVFNMIPAFPLDGGRVFRSILWHVKGNLKWATRVTSRIGQGFGFGLIILGVLTLVTGNLVGGMWWVLIGIFLRGAANMSYQQLLTRRALEGEPVARFMSETPVTVPVDLTLDRLIQDYVYRFHHKLYPVVDDGRLLGCITVGDVKQIPHEEWGSTIVREAMKDCAPTNTISPDEDAMNALTTMNREGQRRLMVVDNGRLLGVITLGDLLAFLAMKIELEGDA